MRMLDLGTTEKGSLKLPLQALLKHFACFGGTGSGKTVLTKVVIEECALQGVPSIVIDSQGDLASLGVLGTSPKIAEQGLTEKQKRYQETVEVLTFTPTSSKGIPVSINPLTPIPPEIEEENAIGLLTQRSDALAHLLDYKLDNDAGKAASSVIYLALDYCRKKAVHMSSIEDLIGFLDKPPSDFLSSIKTIASDKDRLGLIKKLKFLTIGEKKLLFSYGTPLNIDDLLRKDGKKTRINVFYMNTLDSQDEKDFFLSILAQSLYQWMLLNPSQQLQALLVIDEIAPYLPAGMKLTLSKSILQILYKQARKYGIGCLVSTQNPGDIDYKALAQFSTWSLGRLTTKQDRAKIQDALKSLSSNDMTDTIQGLASVQALNFVVFSPDNFKEVQHLRVRYLVTDHTTLTEQALSSLVPKKHKREISVKTTVVERGIPPQFSTQEITNEAGRFLRKKWYFFGEFVEHVSKTELSFRPYILARIRELRPKTFGRPQITEYQILFDGKTGALQKTDGKSVVSSTGKLQQVIGFDEETTRLYATIAREKKGMPDTLISKNLGKEKARKYLSYLRAEKAILPEESEEGKIWHAVHFLKLKKLSAYAVEAILVQDISVEKKEEATIEPLHLPSFIRGLFPQAEVLESQVIWLPLYTLTISGKEERNIVLDGASGKLLH